MIEQDVIAYLQLGDARKMETPEVDAALAWAADEYGLGLTSDEWRTIEIGLLGNADVHGAITPPGINVLSDLHDLGTTALIWLNDSGVLPCGYVHSTPRRGEGWGGDGAARRGRARGDRATETLAGTGVGE